MNQQAHAPLRSVVSFIFAKNFRSRLISVTEDLLQLNDPQFKKLKSNAFVLAISKSDETPARAFIGG